MGDMHRVWERHRSEGKSIKFCIFDEVAKRYSSTWLVKTAKKSDDVYLAELGDAGFWKVSHHNESGEWRVATNRENTSVNAVRRNIAASWGMPPSFHGWVEGTPIVIPTSFLSPLDRELKNDVVIVPTSPLHNGNIVRLFFESPSAEPFGFPSAYPISAIDRVNDGRVYVIAEPVNLADNQMSTFKAMRDEAVSDRFESNLGAIEGRFIGVGASGNQVVLVDLCC